MALSSRMKLIFSNMLSRFADSTATTAWGWRPARSRAPMAVFTQRMTTWPWISLSCSSCLLRLGPAEQITAGTPSNAPCMLPSMGPLRILGVFFRKKSNHPSPRISAVRARILAR